MERPLDNIKTSIIIKKGTVKILKELKVDGESYDKLLRRLTNGK